MQLRHMIGYIVILDFTIVSESGKITKKKVLQNQAKMFIACKIRRFLDRLANSYDGAMEM